MIRRQQRLIIPILVPGLDSPRYLPSSPIRQPHPKKLQNHLIRPDIPRSDIQVFPKMFSLLLGQWLGVLIEPWLIRVGKQPLDVTMIRLQQYIVAPPVFMDNVNELTIRWGGHLVEVELYIWHVDELADWGSAGDGLVQEGDGLDVGGGLGGGGFGVVDIVGFGFLVGFWDGFGFVGVVLLLLLWLGVGLVVLCHTSKDRFVNPLNFFDFAVGVFELYILFKTTYDKWQFLYTSSYYLFKIPYTLLSMSSPKSYKKII